MNLCNVLGHKPTHAILENTNTRYSSGFACWCCAEEHGLGSQRGEE